MKRRHYQNKKEHCKSCETKLGWLVFVVISHHKRWRNTLHLDAIQSLNLLLWVVILEYSLH